MKNYYFISKIVLLSFVAVLFLSCGEEGEKDPCDETVKPEIEVGIKATVHVLTKDGDPIPNQEVKLSLYKKPCGATAKGFFNFDGPTNEQGIRISSTCYYNLRNSDDEVWVDAFAVNLGNGSAEADSELVIYKYNDFSTLSPKEVHVYIHRNF